MRRAIGFKRSEKRMKEIEVKLRRGLQNNGITERRRKRLCWLSASFALYGFPESHAASFALIAYASAYLKCNYLAAFTAAILNNQPMGFYQPFTLIKDAQRHGLKVLPIDVTRSDWFCTIEEETEEGTRGREGRGDRGRGRGMGRRRRNGDAEKRGLGNAEKETMTRRRVPRLRIPVPVFLSSPPGPEICQRPESGIR